MSHEYLLNAIGISEEVDFSTQDSYQFVDRPIDRSVDVTRVLNATNFQDIKRTFIEHNYISYIFLDSNNRLELANKDYVSTNPLNSTMTWELNSSNPLYRNGIINVKDDVCDIVACEIGIVGFADRYNYDGTKSMMPLIGNYLYNQKISILIREFESQSYISQEGTKYHFMLKRKPLILDAVYKTETAIQRSYPTFTPMNKGLYRFSRPISRINSITIQLYCPFQQMPIDQENYTVSVDLSADPITLTFTSDPSILFNEITISNFTTGDPIADANTINQVNQIYISDQVDSTATYRYTRTSPTTLQLNVSSIGLNNTIPIRPHVFVGFNFTACLKIYGRKME